MCAKCQRHLYPGLPADGHLMAAGKETDQRIDEGTGMDVGILVGYCNSQTVMAFCDGDPMRKPARR